VKQWDTTNMGRENVSLTVLAGRHAGTEILRAIRDRSSTANTGPAWDWLVRRSATRTRASSSPGQNGLVR
jgi:hypothetical protein